MHNAPTEPTALWAKMPNRPDYVATVNGERFVAWYIRTERGFGTYEVHRDAAKKPARTAALAVGGLPTVALLARLARAS